MSKTTHRPLRLYPVILSGGSGSRLWPLSREEFPKQLQPLTSARSLLQETALRLGEASHARFQVQAPIVVCNDAHRFVVAEQLRAVGIEPKAIIIEPMGRNTAPAACVAALLLEKEPDALMLVMPSDHLVRKPEAFRAAVAAAVPVAAAGHLTTFGIEPTAPATAYGYIKRGGLLKDAGYNVARFVEKPDAVTAAEFLKTGGYYWNGGIFLWPAKLYLDELARNEPGIAPACRVALDQGQNDLFFFRLDPASFAKVPSQSIDYGVMERTGKAAVVPVDMGWSDVGSWSALHEESARDAAGNTAVGDVMAIDTRNTYVRTEKQLTAVIGIKDAIVVVTADAVLVADKAHDQQVKQIVERLKAEGRAEATAPARTHRPWGWFQTMDEGHRFKVKRLCVKPGAQLSLQKHWHRNEHWVVVTGTALVTRGDADFTLRENESTYISAGTVHRLANPGQVELHMIEVQSGEYVGEDDIVRIADDYGRGDETKAKPAPKAKPKKKGALKKSVRKIRRKADPRAKVTQARRTRRRVVRPSTKVAAKKPPRKTPPKPPRKRR
ncbi:MAG: mannose-1-phosphate guanylyltransferase/mannose-6-phosphate isomerase [Rhodospirillaceae bacterium]|nr:mannose-1-phosphate guanylyltransferase/mannose-6-phosphate isomerase [Rhodospirillaceae bacterium]